MTTAVAGLEPRRWWFAEKITDCEYEVEIVAWHASSAIVMLLENHPDLGWDSGRPFVVRLSQLRTGAPA